MPGVKKEVHAQVLARAFGVHVRTVLRWGERKFLVFNCRRTNRAEALVFLRQWRDSYSKATTRQVLGCCSTQLRNLRKLGAVEAVSVLGFERYTKTSVCTFLAQKRQEAAVFDGFYRPCEFAHQLRGGTKELVEGWLNSGRLQFLRLGGVRVIPLAIAEEVIFGWNSSYSRKEVREMFSVTKDKVFDWVVSGKVQEVSILDFRRISETSVKDLQREFVQRRRGTRRLMTIEDAVKFLDLQPWKVRDLVENATLRSFTDGEETLVYISSVEAHKKTRENASLRVRNEKKRTENEPMFIPGKVRDPVPILDPDD